MANDTPLWGRACEGRDEAGNSESCKAWVTDSRQDMGDMIRGNQRTVGMGTGGP